MPKKELSQPSIQQMGGRYHPTLGGVEYIRIYTSDYRQLSWTEVWEAFSDSYPDQWAVQMFPPKSRLVDEQNIYHLFVMEECPPSMLDICRR